MASLFLNGGAAVAQDAPPLDNPPTTTASEPTDAADAATTDTAKEWLDQNSAGSGPFVLTGWSPKAEIELLERSQDELLDRLLELS